jgi:hypothetical protein
MSGYSEKRSRATRESRGDKQVVARLERLIKKAPIPKKNEDPMKWARRHEAFVREWRAFCRENRTRLLRLDIDTNEIQVAGIEFVDGGDRPTDNVPEILDPRHVAAEEKDTLEKLARKPVRYERLG